MMEATERRLAVVAVVIRRGSVHVKWNLREVLSVDVNRLLDTRDAVLHLQLADAAFHQ
jgi:hypothetical protein